ncbi:hypothetical protein L0F63_004131, partial [Massospora cicadina]
MDNQFNMGYSTQQDFMFPFTYPDISLSYAMQLMDYPQDPPKLTVPSQDMAALPYFFTRERFSSSESIGWDQTPNFSPNCNLDLLWGSEPRNEDHVSKRPRTFQCPVCLKSFDRKFVLKRHMGTHRIDREFSCKPCNMGFYRKDIYDRHIATNKCIRAHQAAYG